MEHLFLTVYELLESVEVLDEGIPSYRWEAVEFSPGRTTSICRLEVGFMRPGRDMPPVIEAGRAPDRTALAWFTPPDGDKVRPGLRVHALSGPVTGTFSVDEIPDQVADSTGLHHYEVMVREVAQVIVSQR